MTSVDVSRAGRIIRSCAQIPTENCCEADTVTSQSLKVQWLLYAPLGLKIPRSAHTVYVSGLSGSQNSHYFPTQRKAKVPFHPLLPDVREGTAI